YLTRGKAETDSTTQTESFDSGIDLENLAYNSSDFADVETITPQRTDDFESISSTAEPKLATEETDWLLDVDIQQLRRSFNLPDKIQAPSITTPASLHDSPLPDLAARHPDSFPSASNTLYETRASQPVAAAPQRSPDAHEQAIHQTLARINQALDR